jgi:Ca2+/Na+ antiporter
MQLIITVLVMVIYAALISLRAGRAMEEQAAIRPLLAGGGVLIIMAGYAWSKGDIEVFYDLVVWFTLCAIPVYLRGAMLLLYQIEQDKATAAEEELRRYSIPRDIEQEREYDSA